MYVVAISNHKGGVGKTTTALCLATSLARRGRRVVAVGLDAQGNLAQGAGIAAADGPSMFELLRGKASAREVARRVPHPGLELLRVIPAGRRLFQAEGWLYSRIGYEDVLRERLASLHKTCELAVLDCSPSLGAVTTSAICAADLVLVPVQCEAFALQGVESLLEVVDLVRGRNPGLEVRLVPTLYDKRNRICKDVLARLKARWGDVLGDVVVGVDTKVRDAQARGLPLCLHDAGSRAALAYDRLATAVEQAAARRVAARAA